MRIEAFVSPVTAIVRTKPFDDPDGNAWLLQEAPRSAAREALRPTFGTSTPQVHWALVTFTGLTGFDIGSMVVACDTSCSDSLIGAPKRIANEQFALAA